MHNKCVHLNWHVAAPYHKWQDYGSKIDFKIDGIPWVQIGQYEHCIIYNYIWSVSSISNISFIHVKKNS
jgi:hypothetical protein